MAFLFIHWRKRTITSFRRLAFLFLAFNSFNALSTVDLIFSPNYEHLQNCYSLENTIEVHECIPNFYQASFFDANGDYQTVTRTQSKAAEFCEDLNGQGKCTFYLDDDGVSYWTPIYTYWDVKTDIDGVEVSYLTDQVVSGRLYTNDCFAASSGVNCASACTTEAECYIYAEAQCGGLLFAWDYRHANNYSGSCHLYQDDPEDSNGDLTVFDPLQGARGEKGDKGEGCTVERLAASARIVCDGTQAGLLDGVDGADGEKGDGCTTFQNIFGETVVSCGDTESIITASSSGSDDSEVLNDIYVNTLNSSSHLTQLYGMAASLNTIKGNENTKLSKLSSMEYTLGVMNSKVSENAGYNQEISENISNVNSYLAPLSPQLTDVITELQEINTNTASGSGGTGGDITVEGGGLTDEESTNLDNISTSIDRLEHIAEDAYDNKYALEEEVWDGTLGDSWWELFFDEQNAMPAATETDISNVTSSSKYMNGSGVSFSNSMACPAPNSLSIMSNTIEISYQPFCDLAATLRPLVLLLAWVFVVKMFLNALRSS